MSGAEGLGNHRRSAAHSEKDKDNHNSGSPHSGSAIAGNATNKSRSPIPKSTVLVFLTCVVMLGLMERSLAENTNRADSSDTATLVERVGKTRAPDREPTNVDVVSDGSSARDPVDAVSTSRQLEPTLSPEASTVVKYVNLSVAGPRAGRAKVKTTFAPFTGPTEIVKLDELEDGVDRITQQDPVNGPDGAFTSTIEWQGKCWYKVTNFCVIEGQLTMFHDPKNNQSHKGSLRMCNEFSQHSPTIMLKYHSVPLPDRLPAPVLTKTKGWILQFWCQDLFHMTLTLMPAFQTLPLLGAHPDIYIRIAKGVRKKKNQYCRVKLGNPNDFEQVFNPKWGDHQFPFPGNPYWPFYKLFTPEPHRILPLYRGATKKSACYREGIIDKFYLKELTGQQARSYSDAQLVSLNVTKGRARQCGRYRLTFIDRRGRTRKVNNTEEIIALATQLGFEAQAVALEHIPIREQLLLMTETDLLLGVHGNGLTWLQYLPIGSVVIELVGVWYMPYAKLFGHTYFNSKMKNNPFYKKNGEYVPFPPNMTELGALLRDGKAALDKSSCGDAAAALAPGTTKLDYLYKDCVPHC